MRWLLVLVLLVACGSDPAPKQPATHDLTGTLKAPECGGGYNIVGASVTVRDDSDKVIGADTTTLIEEKLGFADMVEYCLVGFDIADLPERPFYQFAIGTHGGPAYSLEEMKAADWKVDLNLD